MGEGTADFATHASWSANLFSGGETQPTTGERVDGHYFSLLGVTTVLGRPLGRADDDPATTDRGIVISHDLWMRRFRRDPRILGQEIRLSSTGGAITFTIVGVAAPGFRGISDPWRPSQFWVTSQAMGGETAAIYPIARLKAGTSPERFNAFVETATTTIQNMARNDAFGRARVPPQMIDQISIAVFSTADVRIPSDPQAKLIPTGMLVAMITVVALVLLIATANVAGLLLARGVTRTSELAVRRALGAGGNRLTRQLLTESVLLATAGGLIGLLVAWNLLAVFRATTPSTFALEIPLDWRVLFFAAAVCIGTGVLVGLAPAVQAVRVNVLEALGTGIAGTRRTRARLRYWIVIPQLALSLVLLVLAAVHVRALLRVETSNLGYSTDGALVFRVGLWNPRSIMSIMRLPDEVRNPLLEQERARASAFAQAAIDRVSDIPGVDVAALTYRLPFQPYFAGPYFVVGSGSAERAEAGETGVSGEYFAAMRIRLLSGRVFDTRDMLSATGVAVISRSLERRLWPLSGAVGKTITFGRDLPSGVRSVGPPDRLEVIGVVDDVTPVLGSTAEQPLVYRFVMQEGGRQAGMFFLNATGLLLVRAQGDRSAIIPRIRQVITAADAFAEVSNVQTTEQIVGELLYPRRVGAAVLASAGLVGLALAALGIYGLMSYSVAQRQRELGIRTSLGAAPQDLIRLILSDGARLMAIGGGIGLFLAALVVRLSAGLAPGLPFVDMVAMVSVPAVLTAVILTACYLPARRASRVDPIDVLRGV